MKEREVTINGHTYRFVKMKHETCASCAILKDSGPARMYDYPACYKYTMQGKEAKTDRGLIVNFCHRNLSGIWVKA